MKNDELEKEYFDWLYSIACDNEYCNKKKSYILLLRHLHSIDYRYSMPLDSNRAGDGKRLRYKFRYANGYDIEEIAEDMDSYPCSVLEFLIGIARRMEDEYMRNSLIGDRTGLWFWTMLDNIGIGYMSDDRYYPNFVNENIDILLDRNYCPNGKGGLFEIHNCKADLRTIEFWSQACWYINTII